MDIHLTTRYASTEMGMIMRSLCTGFPAMRTLTGTSITSVRTVIHPYNLNGDGTESVDTYVGVLRRRCRSGIPKSFSTLLGLPKIKEGDTGLVVKSMFNGPTVIASARYVHLSGHVNLISGVGRPGGMRVTL